ncbi:MAG: cytochrome bd-I oxidase subunit CydX [Endozoicomonadaceae bacterium]|nr:cytochrome bd-I oxidase subunit CydX [Endozoicomonadaceae bacterium]MCY4330690.1 cytochrome bd-I oxidase subunit CydX [Endozoicomonadaceae bacterium]
MWYFTWILGVSFAIGMGVINALWYEFQAGGYHDSPEDRDDYHLS